MPLLLQVDKGVCEELKVRSKAAVSADSRNTLRGSFGFTMSSQSSQQAICVRCCGTPADIAAFAGAFCRRSRRRPRRDRVEQGVVCIRYRAPKVDVSGRSAGRNDEPVRLVEQMVGVRNRHPLRAPPRSRSSQLVCRLRAFHEAARATRINASPVSLRCAVFWMASGAMTIVMSEWLLGPGRRCPAPTSTRTTLSLSQGGDQRLLDQPAKYLLWREA